MLYKIQYKDHGTPWTSVEKINGHALDALERRDQLTAKAPDDGTNSKWRVVDLDGNIIEYQGDTK